MSLPQNVWVSLLAGATCDFGENGTDSDREGAQPLRPQLVCPRHREKELSRQWHEHIQSWTNSKAFKQKTMCLFAQNSWLIHSTNQCTAQKTQQLARQFLFKLKEQAQLQRLSEYMAHLEQSLGPKISGLVVQLHPKVLTVTHSNHPKKAKYILCSWMTRGGFRMFQVTLEKPFGFDEGYCCFWVFLGFKAISITPRLIVRMSSSSIFVSGSSCFFLLRLYGICLYEFGSHRSNSRQ